MSSWAHRSRFSRPLQDFSGDQPIQAGLDDTCEPVICGVVPSVSSAHGSRLASARYFHSHMASADICAINGQARHLLTRSLA